ncbi:hypothetical protein RB195_002984 [Necator americanus]|uniref:Uncharacterized protein n=1 Tax=Necator americanus TaxID=51031 RepID=A0ABR1DLJ4_NECAM
MYSIINILFVFLTSWSLITCSKEKTTNEEKSDKFRPSGSSSRSHSRNRRNFSSSISRSRRQTRKTKKQILRPKKTPERIGATPREKMDMIKKGAKRESSAYPTFDDVPSDWGDEKKDKAQKQSSKLRPKQPEMNKKELMIALGAKRQESAYPTMDDVESDWETKSDDAKKKNGSDNKCNNNNKDEVDFELDLLESEKKGSQKKRATDCKQKVKQ